jgi:Zn-dependent protease with chaperone function
MSTNALFYPSTPENVPATVTATSATFKKEVSKVMGSVILFFIVYLLLIFLSVLLALGCVYLGIALIIAVPRFITIMLGIGLVGLGVMVFVFLVKFMFSVARYDRSGIVEIKEKDHPKLFAFIRQLTTDAQTRFPKRIYLSPEVNACVFYDSSFFSMFLPVKKNLQIGLGLVNAVNLSEFKAIMAHEFGHFSQRSMKLGSFVYNVNKVIYNMLFENTSYSRSLQNWANMSGYFAFFAGLTAHIVIGIQSILRKMYSFINRNYMGLSREMEFHADAVAASVSGSANCVSALRRVELAGSSYNTVIQKCNNLYKEKYITSNLYPNQQAVTRHLAKDFKLTLQNDLPVVDDGFLQMLNVTRVNFKDQWASHPALAEREEHLNTLNVQGDRCEDSAWVLFDNPEQWQQQLTTKVYNVVELPQDIQALDAMAFEKRLQEKIALYSLPPEYNNFYENRQISALSIEELSQLPEPSAAIDSIFSKANGGLQAKINATETDIQLLKAIAEKQLEIKTFDFDGEKYELHQAATISEKLQEELTALKLQLETADKQAYCFFYGKALQTDAAKAGELKNGYIEYFNLRQESDLYFKLAQAMLDGLQPIYQGNVTVDTVQEIIGQLKRQETTYKDYLRQWMVTGAFDYSLVLKEKVQHFIDSRYTYFTGTEFYNNELNDLHGIINESWRAINDHIFRKFKSLLQAQLVFLN